MKARGMMYGSVCSGIEAATTAWHPLGWQPMFFSEIEKFPCQVLAHHYGSNMPGEPYSQNGIPNFGDMTKYEQWPDKSIDLLVGGTPCQSFSIAGLRKGLDDPRGNLMLTYLAIARKYRPRWLVWENVPGVLSSNGGRDFAAFLTGLGECGYSAAYRVLDAQYCRVDGFTRAVPQRRRRVFVVGYLGDDWRPPAAVLFERESLSGHIAPSRKTRKSISQEASSSIASCSINVNKNVDDYSACEVADILTVGANQTTGFIGDIVAPVASTLDASYATKYGQDNQHVNAGCPLFVCTLGHSQSNGLGISNNGVANTLEAMGSANQAIANQTFVRRLTPVECERLQGFPDNYTKINDKTANSHRYKALGNSMAVNVMRWIGTRIQIVDDILKEQKA